MALQVLNVVNPVQIMSGLHYKRQLTGKADTVILGKSKFLINYNVGIRKHLFLKYMSSRGV